MEVLPASQRFDQGELCSGTLSTSKKDQSELNATFSAISQGKETSQDVKVVVQRYSIGQAQYQIDAARGLGAEMNSI